MQQHVGLDGHNLVFVVGSPRSGTTYLQRLLANHPQIVTGQESHLFEFIAPLMFQWNLLMAAFEGSHPERGVGLPCYMEEAEFLAAVQALLERLLQPLLQQVGPQQLFLEKTPGHALTIPLIHRFLPRARILHMLRDGRDVVVSLLAAAQSWGKSWAPGDAVAAAHFWHDHVRAVRMAAPSLPADLFYEVKYETLLANPDTTLQDLMAFLGLSWSAEACQQAIAANSVEVARRTGGTAIPVGGLAARKIGSVVQEPPNFIRRGRAGNWQTELTPLQKFQVWKTIRHPLAEVGYPWQFPF